MSGVDDAEIAEILGRSLQVSSPSSFGDERATREINDSEDNVVANSTETTTPNAGMSRAPSGADTGAGLYYDGELRQTANKHVETAKDQRPVFRLPDILEPRDELAFAIVSSYIINYPWFFSFFSREIPIIIATHNPEGKESMKEIFSNWIRTTPSIPGERGLQHMKFMLLFYKTGRLRVMVSTANLTQRDWRDDENSVWIQDVPLRTAPVAHDSNVRDFPAVFTRVLRALNVVYPLLTLRRNGHDNLPLNRIEELRAKWDFANVKVALVVSLAGKHQGWSKAIQTGHTGLMKSIHDLNIITPPGKQLVLECQGSSVGQCSTQWMNEFYCSARGDPAKKCLEERPAQRAKLSYPPIQIIYPSKRTVEESVVGEQGGGNIVCRNFHWESPGFPKECFYDSRSKRGRVLMHAKMIIGIFKDVETSDTSAVRPDTLRQSDGVTDGGTDTVEATSPRESTVIGWAYVGSHNFTLSAWGILSGPSSNPTLTVPNFELGILFPLHAEDELESVACWERPARKYVPGTDEPWMQEKSAFFAETA